MAKSSTLFLVLAGLVVLLMSGFLYVRQMDKQEDEPTADSANESANESNQLIFTNTTTTLSDAQYGQTSTRSALLQFISGMFRDINKGTPSPLVEADIEKQYTLPLTKKYMILNAGLSPKEATFTNQRFPTSACLTYVPPEDEIAMLPKKSEYAAYANEFSTNVNTAHWTEFGHQEGRVLNNFSINSKDGWNEAENAANTLWMTESKLLTDTDREHRVISAPFECRDNWEYIDGLCYKRCEKGYAVRPDNRRRCAKMHHTILNEEMANTFET